MSRKLTSANWWEEKKRNPYIALFLVFSYSLRLSLFPSSNTCCLSSSLVMANSDFCELKKKNASLSYTLISISFSLSASHSPFLLLPAYHSSLFYLTFWSHISSIFFTDLHLRMPIVSCRLKRMSTRRRQDEWRWRMRRQRGPHDKPACSSRDKWMNMKHTWPR